MCGRYDFHGDPLDVEALLGQPIPGLVGAGRYNIAPTQAAPVIHRAQDGLRGLQLRFGWRNARGGLLLNARSETAARAPLTRIAMRQRRCVIPANGFYEWERLASGKKQPHYFYAAAAKVLFFAGVWDPDNLRGGFLVLTTRPNAQVTPVHDRMPVILPAAAVLSWLSPDSPAPLLQDLMQPLPDAALASYKVSPRVNAAAHEAADCIAPLA